MLHVHHHKMLTKTMMMMMMMMLMMMRPMLMVTVMKTLNQDHNVANDEMMCLPSNVSHII